MDEKLDLAIERKRLAEDLKRAFDNTLDERIHRYLEVKPHEMTPWTHFALPSAEATLIFRDGHFYGSIALCQAVAEALVKFMCVKNSWNPSSNYEENVEKLFTRGFITEDLKMTLEEIWRDRDDYHHLNPSAMKNRASLEDLAKKKAKLLAQIEGGVFHFSWTEDGRMVPQYPQYWKKSEGDVYVEAFLKIRP